MKRALLYLVAGTILLVGTAIFIGSDLSLFPASDACMDAGGSFDFSQVRCDFQQSHPYDTFGLGPFWAAFFGACAGIALACRGLQGLRHASSPKSNPLRGAA